MKNLFLSLVSVFFFGACSKPASAPIAVQPLPAPEAAETAQMAAGDPLRDQTDSNVFDQPSPAPKDEPTPSSAISFKNPAATQAVQEYAGQLAALKSMTPPAVSGQDALTNPSSVTSSLREVGHRLEALSQTKAQVQANLEPSEKAKWKAFQKQLTNPENE
jgi:hypothetical protein